MRDSELGVDRAERGAFCYILHCADGSYYVGATGDIDGRMRKHHDGSASRHTAARRPVTLVRVEKFPDMRAARARERQLKGWTRAKKEALIAGSLPNLRRVAARRPAVGA